MTPRQRLPEFIAPMLAQPGEPFDSPEHLFEVKWDGTRALLFVESDGYRLVNRRQRELTERYPEFESFAELPPGTVLDGEVIVLRNGKPDFECLLSREQARSPLRWQAGALEYPATFVVFDQLYDRFRPLLREPLTARRKTLEEVVKLGGDVRLVFSDGVVGDGVKFFDAVCQKGLEGMVAKRLTSTYTPGQRSDAWVKVKPRRSLNCVVIGYLTRENEFRSLALAAVGDAGELRYVGKVGSGLREKSREELFSLLKSRHRAKPIVPCALAAHWVEPGVYCKVSYLERSSKGLLRGPVFERYWVE